MFHVFPYHGQQEIILIILYYIILYYIILYYIISYHIISYRIVLYCIVLYCIIYIYVNGFSILSSETLFVSLNYKYHQVLLKNEFQLSVSDL